MPNPQQYYQRQISPAPTAGNVPVGNLTASGAVSPSDVFRTGLASQHIYEELGRAGNMLTGFGMNALKEIKQAEYHDQLSRAKLAYLQNDFAFKESLAQNADTSKWQTKFEENRQAFRASGYNITNKDAANDFELWLKGNEIEQSHYVNTQKFRVDAENYTNNFNATKELLGKMTVQSLDTRTYQKNIIEGATLYGTQLKKGIDIVNKSELTIEDFEPIANWDNETLVGSPETRMKLFELWLFDTNAKRQKIVLEDAKNFVLGVATSDYVRVNDDGSPKENGRINFNIARKYVEQSGLPEDTQLEIIDDIHKHDQQEQIDNENDWIEFQGKEDVALQKLLDNGDFTGGLKYLESIDSGLRGKYSTEQIKWKKEKKALLEGGLSGKENYDNQIIIDDLKREAFKVYLGETKREDYTKKINNAFYVKHELTANTKDELLAKMDNPLSPAQASAVNSKVSKARQIILASSVAGIALLSNQTPVEAFMASLSKDDKGELADRLKWVQMYDRELTEWVLKNEGDVGKKFEEKAADLQVRYVNAHIEEIQAKIKAKEAGTLLHPERQYKTGDTRTISGITYTYNGTNWTD